MAKKIRDAKEVAVHSEEVDGLNDATLLKNICKKIRVQFRNESQKTFWETIERNQITLCSGPAGTGKSYLSVAKSLQMLCEEGSKYRNIIITTPAVEADEKLGALPGDVDEKLSPYTYSTLYIFEKLIGIRRLEKLMERGSVKVLAFAYMRGMNIDHSIVIGEEIQNATPRQVKTLLTRIGEHSKFILSGDMEQSDRYADSKKSGLHFAIEKLRGEDDIGVFEFKDKDIVRNPIIGRILKRFNGDV
jgi:phosphate starvation-inducible protein PhoH and related proteins